MSKAIRLVVIVVTVCVGIAACAPQQPSPPKATGPSTTKPPPTTSAAVAQSAPTTPTSTPQCTGLDANIEAGQQVHHFEFPTIDKSAVQEVLLTTSTGRCFVIGPGM